ncbi:MAG: hypothetical protein COB49_04500 [Alphaproteobacteria bacterium]|nr:MAG: hypothetical protein COB49_04500 [Alphaproteobacteria bacterium]
MLSALRKKNKMFGICLKSLKSCRKGVVAIEMALVAPIIIMMILASADIISYLLANQRISRASYTISNLITQMDEGLTESQLSDMMLSLDEVTKPLDLSLDGKATVTAIIGVGTDGSTPDSYQVAWQRCFGTAVGNSNFGSAGDTVASSVVPANMIVLTSQILVVTEIVYNFTPLVGFININDKIEYLSYFRPRRGSIENIVNDAASTSTC